MKEDIKIKRKLSLDESFFEMEAIILNVVR
jgi:hypothetical protein